VIKLYKEGNSTAIKTDEADCYSFLKVFSHGLAQLIESGYFKDAWAPILESVFANVRGIIIKYETAGGVCPPPYIEGDCWDVDDELRHWFVTFSAENPDCVNLVEVICAEPPEED
jgi:hypothetical protein